MLISLDDTHERLLRRLAKERHEGRKGSIRAVVEEGIDELAKKAHKELAVERMLARMRKGMSLGFGKGKAYESRNELYD